MRSETSLSRREAARSAVLSQWLLWTTEKDHPSGFPSTETDFCTFYSFMRSWHPHLLTAGRCEDQSTLRSMINADGHP
ncbi:hypothetical protein CRM82_12395 [Comamonas terrigena]|jgi:hypothetical protein|uniref:Uncharacterized protein n=1 Tax=Comamonas terrigena TaxID=32013 RepID=A0A2A7UVK0_COMTR|nr:hypothetical protein [Comamonas terrigena]PEH89288.1 hypothetical protein CRM82_12395 [Comamonas terrigena]SUY71972.1 Uncharacterised protein [Comamonas terrigena]